MVMLESGNFARMRKKLRRSAQETKSAHDFIDEIQIWRSSRPVDGWDTGSVDEGLEMLLGATGKLHENGPGGPVDGEVIFVESAYRLQTFASVLDPLRASSASTPVLSGYLMVVNQSRLFVIDNMKPEDQEDYLIDFYLSEVFGKPMPGGGMQ